MLAIDLVMKLEEFGLHNRLNVYVIDAEGERIYIDEDITIDQHSAGCAIQLTANVGDKISDQEMINRINQTRKR